MIQNLPVWIEYSVFSLSLLAGMVNAIGLLGFEHQSVSHLSGTATMVGLKLSVLDASIFHLLGILLSFVFGAGITGYFIDSMSFQFGKHYDFILLLEGIFLLISFLLLQFHSSIGHYFASTACGMQNALVTTYSGAIIRTTHLTGIFTDLGIMIGELFQGKNFNKRKFIIYLSIITGFISGGALGAFLFQKFEFKTMLLPGFFAIFLAGVYRYFVRTKN